MKIVRISTFIICLFSQLLSLKLLGQNCGFQSYYSSTIYCSLRELNGQNCQALINQDGINCNNQADFIQWYPFYAIGNNSITISPMAGCITGTLIVSLYDSNCEKGPIQTESITTTAKTINFNTNSCKVYRLGIKNSTSNSCQYLITTSSPKIPEIDKGLGIKNKTFNFCKSECWKPFSVQVPSSSPGCHFYYEWDYKGQKTLDNTNSFEFLFNELGTFSLCVTANLQVAENSNICDQITECATIIVSDLPARKSNQVRFICAEKTPYSWNGVKISEDGIFTSNFEIECCTFDSIVEFRILHPELENTHFISCDGSVYVDPITKIVYPQCFSRKKIILQKNQDYGCDNSYLLSTSYPKIKPKWIINNVNGAFEIDPNIQIQDLCDAQIGIESYGWFKKPDPQQTIISKNKKLSVATPDNYCLNYLATIKLGPESQVCSFTFCEPFTQAPIADFTSNKQTFCPGTNVTFTEQSSQDAIAWHWELAGADPAESTLRNPTVYYDKPGIYPVKLTVENQYFSSTITKTTYINVIKSPLCNIKEKRKKKFPIGPGGLVEDELQERSSYDQDIHVLPNPNNGSFIIYGLDMQYESKIEIYDLLGNKLYLNNSTSQSEILEIKDLDLISGTYLIRIKTKAKEFFNKLIISK